jgi:hypothetical protein
MWRENWRRYEKKRFLGHSIRRMGHVNLVRKWTGSIFSDKVKVKLSLCSTK